MSSCEAEHEGFLECVQECIYFRDALDQLGFPQLAPTIIYVDNVSAMTLATDFSGKLKKVKHYVTRINFILEKVRRQVVQFKYTLNLLNVADIGTKPLGPIDFLRLRPNLVSPPYDPTDDV